MTSHASWDRSHGRVPPGHQTLGTPSGCQTKGNPQISDLEYPQLLTLVVITGGLFKLVHLRPYPWY